MAPDHGQAEFSLCAVGLPTALPRPGQSRGSICQKEGRGHHGKCHIFSHRQHRSWILDAALHRRCVSVLPPAQSGSRGHGPAPGCPTCSGPHATSVGRDGHVSDTLQCSLRRGRLLPLRPLLPQCGPVTSGRCLPAPPWGAGWVPSDSWALSVPHPASWTQPCSAAQSQLKHQLLLEALHPPPPP